MAKGLMQRRGVTEQKGEHSPISEHLRLQGMFHKGSISNQTCFSSPSMGSERCIQASALLVALLNCSVLPKLMGSFHQVLNQGCDPTVPIHQCHPGLQKGQEGCGKLQGSQPRFCP